MARSKGKSTNKVENNTGTEAAGSDVLDHILIGVVLAFFLVGLSSAGYLYFKYSKSAHPGGFITNRGKIETITPNTIKFDPNYAWSSAEIRITDRTIILGLGKEVISMAELEEDDIVFVHGLKSNNHIEAVTVTLLPPEPDTDEVILH